MERSLMILFKGVCTQLVATHDLIGPPPFKLFARGEEIQHRVFIADSKNIGDIPKQIDRHIPKLRIHEDHATPELLKKMHSPLPKTWELDLTGLAVTFEELHPAKGASKHQPDLAALPSTWEKSDGRRPEIDRELQQGWSPRTGACVDFTGGVKFTAGLNEVIAQVWFKHEPAIVFRDRNEGDGERFPLKPNTLLEISNLPASKCGSWDYLLHYLATNLDLSDPPNWWQGREPAGEVYCSNSTYP